MDEIYCCHTGRDVDARVKCNLNLCVWEMPKKIPRRLGNEKGGIHSGRRKNRLKTRYYLLLFYRYFYLLCLLMVFFLLLLNFYLVIVMKMFELNSQRFLWKGCSHIFSGTSTSPVCPK